jgi:ATP-dependent DNA helicase RecG
MLTPSELRALLVDLESDRVERTESTQKTDKFARAVCAFANDLPGHGAPGVLIVGARDDGSLAGTPITDELLQNLAALRSDGNILPLPSIRVYKLSIDGADVAVVEVDPSDVPPVRYKGRVCIRVGPRRADASEPEERILSERRASLFSTFDARPVPGATTGELSLRLFHEYRAAVVPPEVVAANHRTIEEQLASLRFFDLRRGVPTVASILLFGTNPRYHLPCAYVQFLRFDGTHMNSRPTDELEASGDLAEVLRHLYAKITAHNRQHPISAEELRERVVADYPEVALRELLLNAVMHRDYEVQSPVRVTWFDDRVEIASPGGLYGGVTASTLRTRSAYRNPVLAEALKELGYVNRYGYGVQRADHALSSNGNPPLEFAIDAHSVAVTVWRRQR